MLRYLDCDHARDYVTRTNYPCSDFHFRALFADTCYILEGWGIALLCENYVAYRVGSGLNFLLCYLRSLLANDFVKILFTTIQFELFKHGASKK